MSLKGVFSATDRVCTFLGDIWRGVNAPEEIISKRRKTVDEIMIATGALGLMESVALRSPWLFAGSLADMSIGGGDLARAGAQVRTRGPG